jgi:hypothetical protein
MPALLRFKCNKCAFSLDTFGGIIYLKDKDDKKNRMMCSYPEDSYRIAQFLRIDEEELFGFPFSPLINENVIHLMNDRVGYQTEVLCLHCMLKVRLDLEHDVCICPNCHHEEIIPIVDLENMECPNCKQGAFTECDTGIYS